MLVKSKTKIGALTFLLLPYLLPSQAITVTTIITSFHLLWKNLINKIVGAVVGEFVPFWLTENRFNKNDLATSAFTRIPLIPFHGRVALVLLRMMEYG